MPFIGAAAVCVLIVSAGLISLDHTGGRPGLRTEARIPVVPDEDIPSTDGISDQDSIVHPPKPADSEEVRLDDFPMIAGATVTEIKTGSKDADVRVGLWPDAPGWVMRFMRRQMKGEFDLQLDRLEKAVSYWYGDDVDAVVYYYDSCVPEYLRSTEGITKEMYKGKMYPRPARVEGGYVFSYQVLEKGPRNFGLVHFLLY